VLNPLFLAAVRFSRAEGALTLPELISDIERRLVSDPGVVAFFRERLFAAGYHEAHAMKYMRRFAMEETAVYSVAEGFPRLVRGSAPAAVTKVVYEIDLSHASRFLTTFSDALRTLGVLK